jgi:hypothetical protein
MNLKLKSKLIERFRIQGAAAKALRLSESRLSRLVTGFYEPTPEERDRFAAMLGEDCFSQESDEEPRPAA